MKLLAALIALLSAGCTTTGDSQYETTFGLAYETKEGHRFEGSATFRPVIRSAK